MAPCKFIYLKTLLVSRTCTAQDNRILWRTRKDLEKRCYGLTMYTLEICPEELNPSKGCRLGGAQWLRQVCWRALVPDWSEKWRITHNGNMSVLEVTSTRRGQRWLKEIRPSRLGVNSCLVTGSCKNRDTQIPQKERSRTDKTDGSRRKL
jgi:hypothetical protein